ALVKSVLKSVMGNFSFLMVGICTYHYRETFPFLFTQNIVHSPACEKKIHFDQRNKSFVFETKEKEFTGKTFHRVLRFIQSVKKYGNSGKPNLIFSFESNIIFADKLTYIIFECVCFSLVEQGYRIQLFIRPEPSILTYGVLSSPLLNLNHNDVEGFQERFNQIIDKIHYRRLIKTSSPKDYLSILTSDIATFLKNNGLDMVSAYQLGEISAELAGNSLEHGKSDCIVDIDISSTHEHEKETGEFVGVNLSIINFSETKFGDLLEDNLENNFQNNKYQRLKEIYSTHEDYFSNEYPNKVFFTLASLQPKISGQYRKSISGIGGLGTFRLLKALREKSFEDSCYLLTSTHIIRFLDGLFSTDDEWIGFNKENDFLLPPDSEVISKSPVDIPGVAYNLNFIIKMKEK
ncbi:hypothetical protein ACI1TM_08900, partial [Lactococcus garvieae]|uniref:hypothetical protein n=1 Tax=Lactococcus garvieae TaxID=1363 RepID=UPI0038529EA4